ncbi:P-loop containing nucleoside triphosphate hydrolase protein [Gigaspora margarita]|uniref:P-loop containing nucleoside triphosphate hydrolase protein n=1 Tax=Gigaspora margarita TaxID=4874 RepID=A0A8H4AKP9_GIGMA|nr:P-loop containing nucleoside triphosphate hydrolase protein [Gigaspora margarita]
MNVMSNEAKKQLSDLRFPAEWHPAARTIQRKIILHIGPTNSGKTYNALKCLGKGVPYNFVTGEERRELKGIHVPLTSSTIEMINLQKQVGMVVIDEIQMISDQQRGWACAWAWTQALLGTLI